MLEKLAKILFIFCLVSCESEKKYSDYDESDFYEVQGIINRANATSNPFDGDTKKDISFSYFLGRETPKTGIEKDLDMFEAQKGYPLIMLVHKEDENISFYGRVGILESLSLKEEEFLVSHLQTEIKKLKD